MLPVIFYRTLGGNEVVLDWLRSLGRDDSHVVGGDLRFVQIGFPVGLPVCRPLGGGLYEVRSTLPSKREARLIFFHDSRLGALIVVHGFIKTTQKTPEAAIDLALKRKREYDP